MVRTTVGKMRESGGDPELQTAAMTRRSRLFVVGSPRSGTTWLQLLLAQHPEIATGRETQLFTQYIARLEDRWVEEQREAEMATTNGLTRVLSGREFQEAIRGFCDRVFDKLAEGNPEASVVLEKSPEHSLHAETILGIYPDAWFLHMIRDPRAVSNSFQHASDEWWTWAPGGPIETTRRWQANVMAGREIANLTTRYREVRYEDLLERGPENLLEIFDWLGLEADLSFSRQAMDACEIDNLKRSGGSAEQPWKTQEEPQGFFRSGRKDSWRSEMPRLAIAIVEREAAGLMSELGYEPVSKAQGAGRVRLRIALHDRARGLRRFLHHLLHRVDWRVDRMLSRM